MPKLKTFEGIVEAMAKHQKGKPLNDAGQLVPDPVPMAPPVNFRPQPSMVDIVRRQVALASEEAKRAGHESLEEADDFDVGDDPELRSPYELDAESEVPISVLKARADQAHEDYLDAKREAGLRMQRDAAGNPILPPKRSGDAEGGRRGVSSDNDPPDDPSGSQDPSNSYRKSRREAQTDD